jgi:hypothetical protein
MILKNSEQLLGCWQHCKELEGDYFEKFWVANICRYINNFFRNESQYLFVWHAQTENRK